MKKRFTFLFFLLYSSTAFSLDVTFFPEKRARNASEIRIKFSEPIAPLGDPSFKFNPIEKIGCMNQVIEGVWEDPSLYVVRFDRPLAGGLLCEVVLKDNIVSAKGNVYSGKRRFYFDTDSILVTDIHPSEYRRIRNDEIFLFRFNGDVDINKNLKNIYFKRSSVLEAVEVVLLPDEDVRLLLKEVYPYLSTRDRKYYGIKAKSRFSDGEKVTLVFKNIESLSGLKGDYIQSFNFTVMEGFRAEISCERESIKRDCIPTAQVNLLFTSPVDVSYIDRIYIQDDRGRRISPDKVPEFDDTITSIRFSPPFSPLKTYRLFLPGDIKDIYDRSLVNIDKFPLPVRMDRMPPLAKFAADFGIVEMIDGEGVVPLTIRGLEKDFLLRLSGITQDTPYVSRPKNIFIRIWDYIKSLFVSPKAIVSEKNPYILPEVRLRQYNISDIGIQRFLGLISTRPPDNNSHNLFKGLELEFEENRLSDTFDFTETTTIGIPIKRCGLYFMEIESSYLYDYLVSDEEKARLKEQGIKGEKAFVHSIVLATGMAVTFKRGRDRSLVFVTHLKDATPVEGADVSIYDCKGKEYFSGKTDKDGVALVSVELQDAIPECEYTNQLGGSGYIVVARHNGDVSFVNSGWNKGIEPYRFNIYSHSKPKEYVVHSILSRNLLRPQETIHIKSLFRARGFQDITFAPPSVLPREMEVIHTGSNKTWRFKVEWDSLQSFLVTWQIPKDAPTGHYDIRFTNCANLSSSDKDCYYYSGGFDIEEFKTPLIKGEIIARQNRDKKSEITIEGIFSYLMGSPANDLPLTLRYRIKDHYYYPTDERYRDIIFARGAVKAGVIRPVSRYSGEDSREDSSDSSEPKSLNLPEVINLTTDEFGRFKRVIEINNKYDRPVTMEIEVGYTDPGGYFYTISRDLTIYNAEYVVGTSLKYNREEKALDIKAVLLDIDGRSISGRKIFINLYRNLNYAHRKRILGGYYSYEHIREVRFMGEVCRGETDRMGEMNCRYKLPSGGYYIVEAVSQDISGERISTHSNYYAAFEDDMWFDYGSDSDRIDLLPDKRGYNPGEVIELRVATPFKRSTILITVEQESVLDHFVSELDAKNPIVRIPVKQDYAPNVIISTVLVRGRLSSPPPAPLVDLAKPAFKMGLVEVSVGKDKYRLDLKITTEKDRYAVGERVRGSVEIKTRRRDMTNVMLIVVDEGLLQLRENRTYNILEGIVGKVDYGVLTSTGMVQVIGKRHYGKKALPQGGGGGRIPTRELFDTLVYFNPALDVKNNKARFEFNLNDSITSFRIVAVAVSGCNRFGSAEKNIESYRELFISSGIPYFARERDVYSARFTIKNVGDKSHKLDIRGSVTFLLQNREIVKKGLDIKHLSIEKGGNNMIEYVVDVPTNVDTAKYHLDLYEGSKVVDSINASQEIVESVPYRVTQSLFFRLKERFEGHYSPYDRSFLGRKINIALMKDLSEIANTLKRYRGYALSCLEQRISYAVVANDMDLFQKLMSEINLYLDERGFLKYYPTSFEGSPFLTAYILEITRLNGFNLPEFIINKTTKALREFIMGKAYFRYRFTTTTYNIERIYALSAIAPYVEDAKELFDLLQIDLSLLPLSSLVDIANIIGARPDIITAIKSHFSEKGGACFLKSEGNNNLWWIMRSADEAYAKSLILLLKTDESDTFVGKMMRGLLNRFERGYLYNTVANAYSSVAFRLFSKKYSTEINSGGVDVSYGCNRYTKKVDKGFEYVDFTFYIDSSSNVSGGDPISPCSTEDINRLLIEDRMNQYWVKVILEERSPLGSPFYKGFKIRKEYLDENGRPKSQFALNDLLTVKITVEPDSQYNNIVIIDPLITGSSVVGRITGDQEGDYPDYHYFSYSDVRNGFIRSYYEHAYSSKIVFEYKARLNVKGRFHLPPTRVELMYMPDIYAEIPNEPIEVN